MTCVSESISSKVVEESDLQEGEVICNRCNGRRVIRTDKPSSWRVLFKEVEEVCPKCWGEGKLDWVENVVGKPRPFRGSSSLCSISSSSYSA